jgi:serine/threonine protein kinase
MQKRFNRYRLTKQIASKPSGSVYLAHRVNYASQKVQLEVFEAVDLTSDQQNESFLQKAKKVKQLSHPSILPIQDFGIEQGHPYIVKEYLAKGSLHRHLDRLSPQHLSLQEALTIVFQVGQTLSYAHKHHILHGNLRPETIFFNSNGEVLLADLGLANAIDLTKLNSQFDLQTLSYMAPEQFVGSLTEKSDLYALACLAYKLITGRVPFAARDFSSMWTKHSTEPPIPLSDLVPNLSKPIEEAVLKAMAKNPSERYANVSIFLRTLEIASFLPTSPLTDSLIVPPATTHTKSITAPLQKIESQASLTRDNLKHYNHASKTLTLPDVDAYFSSKDRLTPPEIDAYFSSKDRLTPPEIDAYHSNKASATPEVEPYYSKEILASPEVDDFHSNKDRMTPPGNSHVEALPKEKLPQVGKPLPPTLWLAFALSGIVILLGTLILYALVPSHPPTNQPMKNSPTPVIPKKSTSQGQTSLTGSYAEQTNQIYNLTSEGTLDWIDWGLNGPGDVNHKLGVQQQINTFNIIGNDNSNKSGTASLGIGNNNGYGPGGYGPGGYGPGGYGNNGYDPNSSNRYYTPNGYGSSTSNNTSNGSTTSGVQRASYASNAKLWWSDGTPVMAARPQQASGIYVPGINHGFTFNVPASTTPRTLRVYLGVNGARGEFTASLNGKAYIDETLNAAYDPKGPQAAGIYTLVFNSTVPDQALTVTYTAITTDGSNGYAMLQAATLH